MSTIALKEASVADVLENDSILKFCKTIKRT